MDKSDKGDTLSLEEWNPFGERSNEWRDRGIIPNEHLASGTDEPWSTCRSLNRLRVQKARCRAMKKIVKISHADVCDCGKRQTHLMTYGDASNCPWTHRLSQPLPVSTVPNTVGNLSNSNYWWLNEEEVEDTAHLQWTTFTPPMDDLHTYNGRPSHLQWTTFSPVGICGSPLVPSSVSCRHQRSPPPSVWSHPHCPWAAEEIPPSSLSSLPEEPPATKVE